MLNPKVHRCIQCHKTFGSAHSLSQYQRATRHNGDGKGSIGNARCRTCKKSFQSPSALSQHMRDKHGPGTHSSKRKAGGAVVSRSNKKKSKSGIEHELEDSRFRFSIDGI